MTKEQSYWRKAAYVGIIYLDLAKAFFKLDFYTTLQKLYNIGITSKLFCWIRSFLTGRNQCVIIEGSHSPMKPTASGIPYGCVIGPVLFLILHRHIDNAVTSSSVSSFADDNRVMSGISSPENAYKLQADLDVSYRRVGVGGRRHNNNIESRDEIHRFRCTFRSVRSTLTFDYKQYNLCCVIHLVLKFYSSE